MKSERMAKMSTAPAAASLAFLASSFCSFVTKSTVYSIALFIISDAITTKIHNKIRHHSILLIFRKKAKNMAVAPALKCIRIFAQCRKTSKIPLVAYPKALNSLLLFNSGKFVYKFKLFHLNYHSTSVCVSYFKIL